MLHPLKKRKPRIKYTTAIKHVLSQELIAPSEKFVSFILDTVYDGIKTKGVKKSFAPIIHDAFREFIDDCMRDGIEPAPHDLHGKTVAHSDWISLTECEPNTNDLPITVRLWNGEDKIVKFWTHLPRIIARSLFIEKLLTLRDLPYRIGGGKSFIINSEPMHPDGTPFNHSRTPLPDTTICMYMIANPEQVKSYSLRMLKDFGKNPDVDVLIMSNRTVHENSNQ